MNLEDTQTEEKRNKKQEDQDAHLKPVLVALPENAEKQFETDENQIIHINKQTSDLNIELNTSFTAIQIQSIYDENKKLKAELNKLKAENSRLVHENNDINSTILKKEDEVKALNNKLSIKDSQLTDSKNKEIQIRRIAKKYKDSYFQLKESPIQQSGHTSTVSGNMETVQEMRSNLFGVDVIKKQYENNILTENRKRIRALTDVNRQMQEYKASSRQQFSHQPHQFVEEVVKIWKDLDVEIARILTNNAMQIDNMAQLKSENKKLNGIIDTIQGSTKRNSSDLEAVGTSRLNPFVEASTSIGDSENLRSLCVKTTISNSSTNCATTTTSRNCNEDCTLKRRAENNSYIEAFPIDKKPCLEVDGIAWPTISTDLTFGGVVAACHVKEEKELDLVDVGDQNCHHMYDLEHQRIVVVHKVNIKKEKELDLVDEVDDDQKCNHIYDLEHQRINDMKEEPNQN